MRKWGENQHGETKGGGSSKMKKEENKTIRCEHEGEGKTN